MKCQTPEVRYETRATTIVVVRFLDPSYSLTDASTQRLGRNDTRVNDDEGRRDDEDARKRRGGRGKGPEKRGKDDEEGARQ